MKVSVLIAVYAKESPDFLASSLQSLVTQTRQPEEVVLVEDGPLTPALESVIEKFRVRLHMKSIRLQSNMGLAGALNEGLKNCSYPLVARMDSDDICLPERLEKQVETFQKNPALDLVGCFAVEIDSQGNRGVLRTMPVEHEDIMASMWTCPFVHPTVMFRRNKMLALGGYRQSLRRRQDYELWFRCAKAGFAFANVPEPLILYRFDRNTHKKQSPGVALEQAMIGFRGASLLGMTYWKRLACFFPFFRTLLPPALRHAVYRAMRKFDPRNTYDGGIES